MSSVVNGGSSDPSRVLQLGRMIEGKSTERIYVRLKTIAPAAVAAVIAAEDRQLDAREGALLATSLPNPIKRDPGVGSSARRKRRPGIERRGFDKTEMSLRTSDGSHNEPGPRPVAPARRFVPNCRRRTSLRPNPLRHAPSSSKPDRRAALRRPIVGPTVRCVAKPKPTAVTSQAQARDRPGRRNRRRPVPKRRALPSSPRSGGQDRRCRCRRLERGKAKNRAQLRRYLFPQSARRTGDHTLQEDPPRFPRELRRSPHLRAWRRR